MWVQKAINVLANNISPLTLRVTTGTGQDKTYLDKHGIYELLENPNPEMGLADIFREWIVNQMLGGECGIEAVKNRSGNRVIELWPRQPQTFTVRPKSLRYRSVSFFKVDDGNGEAYNLTPEEFIHLKFYNPVSPFRGVAPITAVKLSIVIDQLAQAWTRLFFRNQARPDFAVVAAEGMTIKEKNELENQLSAKFGTNEGVHKPIILESGVTDIKPFSWAPKDMEWVNQREFSRDEIGAVFGVPDEVMGYGRDTYENFGTAEKVLWTLTIMPLCKLRDDTLTRFFRKAGMLAQVERLETDFRLVPQLQEDYKTRVEQAAKLFTMGIPFNMIDNQLKLGFGEIPGGEVGYLPFGIMPVGSEQDNVSPVADSTSEDQDDRSAPGTSASDDSSEAPAAEQDKSIVKRDFRVFGSAEHEALWKRLQARIDVPVGETQRLAKKEFQREQSEITRKLKDSKVFGRGFYKKDESARDRSAGLTPESDQGPARSAHADLGDGPRLDSPTTKDSERIPSISELFDLDLEITLWKKVMKKPVAGALMAIARQQFEDLGMDFPFSIDKPEVVVAIEGILDRVARKTNESTWRDLSDLFEEAERAGEGIPAIQERLSTYFGDRKSDWQTERIARTTMNNAANAGDIEAWRQSERVSGKTWIAALDDRTRDAHAQAHGDTVGINEMFNVGGEMIDRPGDGSADNSINCRCDMVPVVMESE
jgi:HK97 family phage portal protein